MVSAPVGAWVGRAVQQPAGTACFHGGCPRALGGGIGLSGTGRMYPPLAAVSWGIGILGLLMVCFFSICFLYYSRFAARVQIGEWLEKMKYFLGRALTFSLKLSINKYERLISAIPTTGQTAWGFRKIYSKGGT